MRITAIILLGIFLYTGCGINSNFMFQPEKDFEYDEIPEGDANKEYLISPNDKLQLRLFANDGFKIINITSSSGNSDGNRNNNNFNNNNTLTYLVQEDSTVKLPILNDVKLAGFTVQGAADTLESMYAEYYVEPFAQVTVMNRRVVVFPGNGGDAKVITLTNNNTTVLEALARAGGITDRGKAKNIKIMRKVKGVRKIYKIDLSTMDGLSEADMTVQANDYIYVKPVPQISRELLREIAPIISIISSAAVVISVVRTIQQ